MAGMTTSDIDVAEVHDASAPAELMLYEELGFCPEGEGGRLIDEGVTEIGEGCRSTQAAASSPRATP